MEITRSENVYLKSLIDPRSVSAPHIPDLNLKQSVAKTIALGINITQNDTYPTMVVFLPYSRNKFVLRYYRWDFTNQMFSLDGITGGLLFPDEDLSDNYDMLRLVSADFKAVSATISAGNFAVSGTFNAIAFATPPNLRTITFDTITSQRQDDLAVMIQGPVQNGFVYTAWPDESVNFQGIDSPVVVPPPVTNTTSVQLRSSHSQARVYRNFALNPNVNPGAACLSAEIPDNCWGNIQFSCDYTFGSATSGLFNFRVVARTYLVNAANVRIVQDNVLYNTQSYVAAGLGTGHVGLTLTRFIPQDINVIFLDSAGTNTAAITSQLFSAELVSYDNYCAQNGPGALVAWSGVNVANQMSLSSILNYEVVPNRNLIRNVKIVPHPISDPEMLARAELVFVSRSLFGIKTIYNFVEFEELRAKLDSLIEQERTVGEAAGGRFLERMKRLSGILGKGTSTLTNTLMNAGMYHPALPIAGKIGGLMTAFGNSASTSSGSVGYCSSTPQTVEQQMAQMRQMMETLMAENARMKDQLTQAM